MQFFSFAYTIGPIFKYENDRAVLVGVVSIHEDGCYREDFPNYYAKVSVAMDWIKEELQNEVLG